MIVLLGFLGPEGITDLLLIVASLGHLFQFNQFWRGLRSYPEWEELSIAGVEW